MLLFSQNSDCEKEFHSVCSFLYFYKIHVISNLPRYFLSNPAIQFLERSALTIKKVIKTSMKCKPKVNGQHFIKLTLNITDFSS